MRGHEACARVRRLAIVSGMVPLPRSGIYCGSRMGAHDLIMFARSIVVSVLRLGGGSLDDLDNFFV